MAFATFERTWARAGALGRLRSCRRTVCRRPPARRTLLPAAAGLERSGRPGGRGERLRDHARALAGQPRRADRPRQRPLRGGRDRRRRARAAARHGRSRPTARPPGTTSPTSWPSAAGPPRRSPPPAGRSSSAARSRQPTRRRCAKSGPRCRPRLICPPQPATASPRAERSARSTQLARRKTFAPRARCWRCRPARPAPGFARRGCSSAPPSGRMPAASRIWRSEVIFPWP